jgi:hypothetical protein
MTREKLLLELQELVLTLKSPNIKDDNVKQKWLDRVELFNESLNGLSKDDIGWLDLEYRIWIKDKFGDIEFRS